MTDIKASAWEICERVAEAQALLHDHTEGGFTADELVRKLAALMSEEGFAASDVGRRLLSARHPAASYNRGELVGDGGFQSGLAARRLRLLRKDARYGGRSKGMPNSFAGITSNRKATPSVAL